MFGMRMSREGSIAVEAALAQMIQNQAELVAERRLYMEDQRRHQKEMEAVWKEFAEIRKILLHHEQMLKDLPIALLKDLPEAVRQKIGFKTP